MLRESPCRSRILVFATTGDALEKATAALFARSFAPSHAIETQELDPFEGAFLLAFDQRRDVIMANVENMSNPVTRSELQAELRPIQHNIEVLNGDVAKLKVDVAELKVDVAELKVDVAEVKGRLQRVEERMATRHDLEIWAGALMARTDEKFKLADQRMDRFEQQMKESERRLLNEVASHMKAYQEAMITQINVIQEQYADLPPRTSRLETAVFGARQR